MPSGISFQSGHQETQTVIHNLLVDINLGIYTGFRRAGGSVSINKVLNLRGNPRDIHGSLDIVVGKDGKIQGWILLLWTPSFNIHP